jgi:pimeloyl-ACP methyl ester carboxylesterase
MTARTVDLRDGISYYVRDVGEGRPVLLLHGYPDTGDIWREQIPVLVEQGYRVIAPDLRGFGQSSKPPRVNDYKITQVVGDISALMQALDIPRAHLVGHDWGAATAWVFASLMPAKVDHLVTIAVGHPLLFYSPPLEQRIKSWYWLFFQFEGIAEQLLQKDGWALFREMIGDTPEMPGYIRHFSKPGNLTAALNWYRANRAPAAELEPPFRLPLIGAPTLTIFGARDIAITEGCVAGSGAYVTGYFRYERFEDAGHQVPLDEPELLNKLLIDFLDSQPTGRVDARTRRRF